MVKELQRYSVKIGKLRHTGSRKKDLEDLKKLFGAPKAKIHKIKKPYRAG